MNDEARALLADLHEAVAGTKAAHGLARLQELIKEQEDAQFAEAILCVSFAPEAIREHFDFTGIVTTPRQDSIWEWLNAATEEEIRDVGEECVQSDSLWRMFDDLLEEAIMDRVEGAADA